MDVSTHTPADGLQPEPGLGASGLARGSHQALITWEWGSHGRSWLVRAVPGREVLLRARSCREAIRRAEDAGLQVVGPYRPRRLRRAKARQLSFPFY